MTMKRKAPPDSHASLNAARKRAKKAAVVVSKQEQVTDETPSGGGPFTIGFDHLPTELLYELMLTSVCPSLPLVSRRLYCTFKSTSAHFKAQYILSATSNRPPDPVLRNYWANLMGGWLRFGICDLEVFKTLESTFHPPARAVQDPQAHGYTALEPPKRILGKGSTTMDHRPEGWLDDAAELLRYILEPRTLSFPASRVWKPPEQEGKDHLYRVEVGAADPNAHGGFLLARAVNLGHRPLIELLLDHGASPVLKKGLSVKFAIAQKDVSLVRALLGGTKTSVKLGKLGQELLSMAVKENAREISDYLVKEHAVVPDMATLTLLMKSPQRL